MAKKNIDYIAAEEDALLKFQFALIDAMSEAGLTKADLAKALGVSRARVSQMLDSDANPTLKVIARAFAVLDYDLKYCSQKENRQPLKAKAPRATTGLLGIMEAIHTADPYWAIQEARAKAPANQDYWHYVQAA
jgi:transcriptional regulator with XRE-family HTH domain